MSSAKVDICNLALGHLGISTLVQNFDTDKSKEAKACRVFYEQTREQVLRGVAWPFATVIEDLGLVESDPNGEWAYSYRYPANALTVRRIPSGARVDSQDSRIPYRVGRDDDGLLIYTDIQDAKVEYTFNETDTSRFPPDFVNAFAYLLAAKIGPSVTGGDQFKLSNSAFQFYQLAIGEARDMAFNEEQADQPPDSEFIRARN